MKRRNILFAILFVLPLGITLVTACDNEGGPAPSADQSITEITESDEDFSGLDSIIKGADLTAYLEGDGPFTVFAPRNDAIKLPDGIGISVGKIDGRSKEKLSEILKYHVLNSEISSSDLDTAQTIEAAAGGELFITKEDGNVRINDTATVTTADIGASNGIIHRIDQLLLPDKYRDVVGIIAKRYRLQTLDEAVVQAELADTLKKHTEGGYTVFAPSNTAFEEKEEFDLERLTTEEIKKVLTYHILPKKVLSGGLSASQTLKTLNGETLDIAVSVDGTVSITDKAGKIYEVTEADLVGANGVVHVIDGVLMPD